MARAASVHAKSSIAESFVWQVNDSSSHYAIQTKERLRSMRGSRLMDNKSSIVANNPALSESHDKYRAFECDSAEKRQSTEDDVSEEEIEGLRQEELAGELLGIQTGARTEGLATKEFTFGRDGKTMAERVSTEEGESESEKKPEKEQKSNRKTIASANKKQRSDSKTPGQKSTEQLNLTRFLSNSAFQKKTGKPVFEAFGYGSLDTEVVNGVQRGLKTFNNLVKGGKSVPKKPVTKASAVQKFREKMAEPKKPKSPPKVFQEELPRATILLTEELEFPSQPIKVPSARPKPRAVSAKITEKAGKETQACPLPASSFGRISVVKAIYAENGPLNLFAGEDLLKNKSGVKSSRVF